MTNSGITKAATTTLWVAALGAAIAHVIGILRRPDGDVLADFHVYYGSVQSLLDGGSLYGFSAANGDPFTYPPFAGLILAPIGLLQEAVGGAIWTAATLALVIVAAFVVAKQMWQDPSLRQKRTWLVPFVALVLLVAAPLSSNLRFGQISWFLVVLVSIDALKLVPAKYRGIATGIASAVKLTPLIFIPFYWFSGRRREAVTSLATFAGCTGLGWLVLPGDSNRFWLGLLFETSRIGDLSMGGNQSLNGMLLRLGAYGQLKSVALLLMSVAVLGLGMWRASRAARNGHLLAGAAIVGATAVAISPVSWTHHQVWLVVAVAATFERRWVTRLWRISVLLLMIISFGTLLSGSWPVLAQLGGNSRALLAVAIAAVLPFAETRRPQKAAFESPGDARIPTARKQSAAARVTRWFVPRTGSSTALAVALAVGLAACGDPQVPQVNRPSGQNLVTIMSSGDIDGFKWQAEIVTMNGQNCTQSVAGYRIMANSCGDQPTNAEVPVNIAVEGNDKILFVRGIVGPAVVRLSLVTKVKLQGEDLKISEVDGVRYVGFGVKPTEFVDLVGYDVNGQKVYSGAGKIISTFEDSMPGVPSPTAA